MQHILHLLLQPYQSAHEKGSKLTILSIWPIQLFVSANQAYIILLGIISFLIPGYKHLRKIMWFPECLSHTMHTIVLQFYYWGNFERVSLTTLSNSWHAVFLGTHSVFCLKHSTVDNIIPYRYTLKQSLLFQRHLYSIPVNKVGHSFATSLFQTAVDAHEDSRLPTASKTQEWLQKPDHIHCGTPQMVISKQSAC